MLGSGLPVWVTFSDIPFGVVDYHLVVYQGMVPVMGLTGVSARGGLFSPERFEPRYIAQGVGS